MRAHRDGFYVSIPADWSPEQADWAFTLFDRIQDAIWHVHGDAIHAYGDFQDRQLELALASEPPHSSDDDDDIPLF